MYQIIVKHHCKEITSLYFEKMAQSNILMSKKFFAILRFYTGQKVGSY